MYARRVSMNLKPNKVSEFTQTLEKEIIPKLRKQKGFQDEITLVSPDGVKVVAISLWDKAENATAYNSGTFPEVTRMLSSVADGTPKVETYEVANSTFHKVHA